MIFVTEAALHSEALERRIAGHGVDAETAVVEAVIEKRPEDHAAADRGFSYLTQYARQSRPTP